MKIIHRGFTLIELLIVIAIAAIVASLAVPSFRTMLVKRSVQSTATSFVEDMRFARTEALRRSSRVTMCSLADSSTGTCANTDGKWTNGWVVFADSNGDSTVDTGEEIVRVQQGAANVASIVGKVATTTLASFKFEANGWCKVCSQCLDFSSTGSGTSAAKRKVVISNQGRPALSPEGASVCQ